MTCAGPIQGELRSFALWLGTDILSQARAEETLTWIRAGSQSATSRGPRLEDDKDIRGKTGGTERKWVTDDSPELLDQLVQNLTPPLSFPVTWANRFPGGLCLFELVFLFHTTK